MDPADAKALWRLIMASPWLALYLMLGWVRGVLGRAIDME